MSRIFALPSLKVKATRKSPHPSAPFGAGIIPLTGHLIPFAGIKLYTQSDLDWAAQAFADDASEPDYDALAQEAAYYAQFDEYACVPVEFGRCELCGIDCDYLEPNGLCPSCDVIACEHSTTQLYR